ncbi:exosome complex component RRP45A-like isoform X2 [Tasmannia lanceolata]
MGFVTSQLVQPYRDRPNEGTLSIFTEFSPMADPSFEAGRPGEFAIELGRIIDRGLRESRAVDTESLCVLAGKLVWAIRVDLHILDNGGNLVDAANVAALAALLTFRRPECTLGGEDGQEVTVHPPEVKEPLPLIVHHLPIAVTFAFFHNGDTVVVDPSHHEEAVMGGKMTATLNTNGDICAVQKAGGEGIIQSVIMQCLRIASMKVAVITTKIKDAVEAYNTERALKKVKRHSSLVAVEVGGHIGGRELRGQSVIKKEVGELSKHLEMGSKDKAEERFSHGNIKGATGSSLKRETYESGENAKTFIGGPSTWDPYSKGIDVDSVRNPRAPPGTIMPDKEQQEARGVQNRNEAKPVELAVNLSAVNSATIEPADMRPQVSGEKSLKDAVKAKNKKKKNPSSLL